MKQKRDSKQTPLRMGGTEKELFFRHVAQTSAAPMALEIVKAKGSILTDKNDKKYIDLIAGISVCNVGHRHPKVVKAIKKQADEYLHLLVYGEMVESPQVQYAHLLASNLPTTLDCVYFTNSGAEATEGAMKLAKRITGRTGMIAFQHSYHGSTQGALSVMGDEYWRNAFRPLLPGVRHLSYNSQEAIEAINETTACVIAESVQAEKGVIVPDVEWMQALRKKCTDTGTLLILDEIQTGFGRTGTLWAFEKFKIVPDVILLGKALGGGMPLGAFVASHKLMQGFTDNPVLGHITTFGGHPVCCAAGLASLKVILKEELVKGVKQKEKFFRSLLKHKSIKHLRSSGLLMALELDSFETNKKVIQLCLSKGLLSDWFLFAPECLRIAPPLTITEKEIRKACSIIIESLDELAGNRMGKPGK